MTYNFNARKKSWLCVFNLPYKRNMARRWHVAAHNRPNGHQEHGRITHIVLRPMKAHGGLFVIIFTCVRLPKIYSKKMQIVRAGFAVVGGRGSESGGRRGVGEGSARGRRACPGGPPPPPTGRPPRPRLLPRVITALWAMRSKTMAVRPLGLFTTHQHSGQANKKYIPAPGFK